MTAPVRVAVVSTGNIGAASIRSIVRRPDLELVGVWVHSDDKVGQDAGALAGIAPIGLAATHDLAEIVASAPDCAVYAATGPDLDAVAVPHYELLLRGGINVVTTATPGLVFPKGWDPVRVAALEAAAAAGGATLYASGIEPGFVGDHLALVLATQSEEIVSLRTQEIFSYADYANEFLMRDVFGFGMPMDSTPLMELGGSQLMAWGPPVKYVADGLGVELDEIRETYERRATERDLDVACGTIAAGTCGAIRMETIGVVAGRDAIVIEHVNRMADDIAPDWPTADRDGTYRIVVEGTPSMTCELTLGSPETASVDGLVATAMRVVNAIPAVVAAGPGLVTSRDLPLTVSPYALDLVR
ncbi:MAG: dihydrodipicolinate reductase [Marmoricola sp.]|nr:dihydrodipicolinate reductase [Marmoricola sp.]